MKLIAKVLFFSSLTLLVACDDEINSVKEYTNSSIDSTMTIGQALETSKTCIDGKWTHRSDNRGRSVVSYSCSLPTDYIETINRKIQYESALFFYTTALPYKDKIQSELLKLKADTGKQIELNGLVTSFTSSMKTDSIVAKFSWYVVKDQPPLLFDAQLLLNANFCETECVINGKPESLLTGLYLNAAPGKIPSVYIETGRHIAGKYIDSITNQIKELAKKIDS